MLALFIENRLATANESGFKPGDSCINYFIAIAHKLYQSFGEGYKVWGVFLDISKVCANVWHESLTFRHESLTLKFKQNGISGKLSGRLSET